jgi:hypothetical protein
LADEVAAKAPDDLMLGVELLNLPPGAGPQTGRIAVLEVTHLGKPGDLDRLLAPFKKLGAPLADQIQAKTYLEAQGAAGTAPIAVPGSQKGTPQYIKTGFLHSSPTAFIDELVRGIEAGPPSQMLLALWAQVGGAVARVKPEATAYWGRNATADLLIESEWQDRAQDEANIKTVRTVWGAVQKFTEGFYVNTEPGADDKRVRGSYGGNYERLRKLKAQYDASNLFRLNANIKPTAA